MKRREFAKLPVYIEEDHNEVLPFIYRCIGSRHLPFEENTLIHFDSHPDFLVNKDLHASDAWDKNKLYKSLSIENWILPGCFTGQFSKVWWVKPPWSKQIPKGRYDVVIGQFEDKIRVATYLYYFLSDGIFVDETRLINKRTFELCVTSAAASEATENISHLTEDTGYILDIDLDYFSTRNPFLDLYSAGNLYTSLRPIFTFSHPKDSTDYKNVIALSLQRKQQLDLLESIFEHLEHHGTLEEFEEDVPVHLMEQMKKIVDVVNTNYDSKTFDWSILFNAGMTCDESELPHHVTSEEDLSQAVDQFSIFLRCLPFPPTIVTIARSSRDDYCPVCQVDSIQEKVLRVLQEVFGGLDVKNEYENA